MSKICSGGTCSFTIYMVAYINYYICVDEGLCYWCVGVIFALEEAISFFNAKLIARSYLVFCNLFNALKQLGI